MPQARLISPKFPLFLVLFMRRSGLSAAKNRIGLVISAYVTKSQWNLTDKRMTRLLYANRCSRIGEFEG